MRGINLPIPTYPEKRVVSSPCTSGISLPYPPLMVRCWENVDFENKVNSSYFSIFYTVIPQITHLNAIFSSWHAPRWEGKILLPDTKGRIQWSAWKEDSTHIQMTLPTILREIQSTLEFGVARGFYKTIWVLNMFKTKWIAAFFSFQSCPPYFDSLNFCKCVLSTRWIENHDNMNQLIVLLVE